MKIIKPSVEFYGVVPTDYENALKFIEKAGRTCYKSEDKITEDSAEKFVKKLIKAGHLAMVEHSNFVIRRKVMPGILSFESDIVEFLKGKPINKKTTATFNAIGFMLLIALMFAVTYSDVAKIFFK